MAGLARYSPLWDQGRAGTEPSRVLQDTTLLLATDFEGGNGAGLRRLGPDHYYVRLEPEPGEHPYSGNGYYLSVGLQNRSGPARTVRLRVQAPTKPEWRWGAQQRHMVLRRGGEWSQLDPAAIHQVEGTGDAVDVDLPLPGADEPDPTLFVSNYHWWPYSEVVAWLQSLPPQRARVVEIARSYQGRPLYAVEIGEGPPGAPCMVHTQTPQPAEMGSLACRAMVDYLCSDAPGAGDIRHRFSVRFIPATNPDGTVQGYGVSDCQGRFPFFEGHLAAAEDPAATPETAAVWRYLSAHRPWLFWEWHSNHWTRRPGHMLLRYRHNLLPDATRERLWDDLEERLLVLPDTHDSGFTSWTEGGYQHSMGFQAVVRLGAIACMIKHHDKFPLAQSRVHAVACLRSAAAAWDAAYPGG